MIASTKTTAPIKNTILRLLFMLTHAYWNIFKYTIISIVATILESECIKMVVYMDFVLNLTIPRNKPNIKIVNMP